MLVSDFQYDLPSERIAQEPLADRSGSRLLHLKRPGRDQSGGWEERSFREFPDLLRADDLLVVNNTRVFPARLYGYRSGQKAVPVSADNPAARDFLRGRVEVLLIRQVADDPNEWRCVVRPGKKIGVGEKLYFTQSPTETTGSSVHRCVPRGSGSSLSSLSALNPSAVSSSDETQPGIPGALEAEVIERGDFGERRIRFAPVPDFFARVERLGHTPLPPYIHRGEGAEGEPDDKPDDRERYQTIYAQARGSVAAPTAGLHFTPEILDRIRGRGIEIAEVTLHVGLGTFQPVRVDKVEDHKLHREWYEIPAEAARAINRAKAEGRRVVAVGTTTVRTLEYAGAGQVAEGAGQARSQVEAGQGEADAFIYPGYKFRIVGAMLTNFHLPQSTLLMLVCALGGKEFVMNAYRHAVEAEYRFYSYGDCMFVE